MPSPCSISWWTGACARRLTTVIDTLGLDADRRRGWLDPRPPPRPAVRGVAFDTPAGECRARNRLRQPPVPAAVLTGAAAGVGAAVSEVLAERGVRRRADARRRAGRAAGVRRPDPATADAPQDRPSACASGSRSPASPGPAARPSWVTGCGRIAAAAEEAGFDSHLAHGPLPSDPACSARRGTTCSTATRRSRTSPRCTSGSGSGRWSRASPTATWRHLGQDRRHPRRADAEAGPGAVSARLVRAASTVPTDGTSRRRAERYALLEDALQLLPLMWGPGTPGLRGPVGCGCPRRSATRGRCRSTCPILVGGRGRAAHAAARGPLRRRLQPPWATPPWWRPKIAALRGHCRDAERDPATVDRHPAEHRPRGPRSADEVDALAERLRPPRVGAGGLPGVGGRRHRR